MPKLFAPTIVKRVLLGAIALGTAGLFMSSINAGNAPKLAEGASAHESQAGPNAADSIKLTVHKSPTCGCCGAWVTHVDEAGFATHVNDTHQMNAIKQQHAIDPRLQSCHTAVSADGAHFFEGHVPARLIREFLNNTPAGAAGLAVPGMPLGSPGMEMGARFDAYDVWQVNRDGSVERYAHIAKAEDQI